MQNLALLRVAMTSCSLQVHFSLERMVDSLPSLGRYAVCTLVLLLVTATAFCGAADHGPAGTLSEAAISAAVSALEAASIRVDIVVSAEEIALRDCIKLADYYCGVNEDSTVPIVNSIIFVHTAIRRTSDEADVELQNLSSALHCDVVLLPRGRFEGQLASDLSISLLTAVPIVLRDSAATSYGDGDDAAATTQFTVLVCFKCLPVSPSAAIFLASLLTTSTASSSALRGCTFLDAAATAVTSRGFEVHPVSPIDLTTGHNSQRVAVAPSLAGISSIDSRVRDVREAQLLSAKCLAIPLRVLQQDKYLRNWKRFRDAFHSDALGVYEVVDLELWRWMCGWKVAAPSSRKLLVTSALIQCGGADSPALPPKGGALSFTPQSLNVEVNNVGSFADLALLQQQQAEHDEPDTQLVVIWSFWCCQCCGFSQEILGLLVPLERRGVLVRTTASANCFCSGAPSSSALAVDRMMISQKETRRLLQAQRGGRGAKSTSDDAPIGSAQSSEKNIETDVVWIGHGDCQHAEQSIEVFTAPERARQKTMEQVLLEDDIEDDRQSSGSKNSPTSGAGSGIILPNYVVSRIMIEFSILEAPSVLYCNSSGVDELWVPSSFARDVLVASGVPSEKITILPEAIDVHFFDPDIHQPLLLPPIPPARIADCYTETCFLRVVDSFNDAFFDDHSGHARNTSANFKFLSVFKWEGRKGWETLFDAYFDQFTSADAVSLYVLTHQWYAGKPSPHLDVRNPRLILEQIVSRLRKQHELSNDLLRKLPHFVIICDEVTEEVLARMYRSVDAFVLPSHGEGWGLPLMQAMSMRLPTIGTNWSGNTEFMTVSTSYLIPVVGLEEIATDSIYKWFPGKEWAIPSVPELGKLMLSVWKNAPESRQRGIAARAHIVSHFSEEIVSKLYEERLAQIHELLQLRAVPIVRNFSDGLVNYSGWPLAKKAKESTPSTLPRALFLLFIAVPLCRLLYLQLCRSRLRRYFRFGVKRL